MSKSSTYKYKSMSLEKFMLGIYTPNICFLNLQYGNTKNEINNIRLKYNIDIYELNEVDNFYPQVGIVLDVDWGNEQALVYWTGNATHYEYIDELEVIQ